ncbi:MAG TPA: DUF4870 domain-containing protein [Propionibacteriaceae bacterium]|nr:DUF4870 domain-containing protein [Propionibacteriaceae bacterium]
MSTPYTQPGFTPAVATPEEKSGAIIAPLSTIAAMILSVGWLGVVGPLIVWFLYKDRSQFVRSAAAGSLNFNLWAFVMNIVAWICLFTVVLIPVAIVLWILTALSFLVHIRAAMVSARGEQYKYPAEIRVLSH